MFATAMPQGATSLMTSSTPKRMGFTIESLVGSGGNHNRSSSPPKSDGSNSPPLMNHSPPRTEQISPIAAVRLLSSSKAGSYPSPTTTSYSRASLSPSTTLSPSETINSFPRFNFNNFNSISADLQRNILAIRDEQAANDAILREQFILRQRVQHLTQEQFLRNSLAHTLEQQNLRANHASSPTNNSTITNNSITSKKSKQSPKNSPRNSPRSSPTLQGSPPLPIDEETTVTSSPSIRRPQPSSPSSAASCVPSHLLNPLHNHILPPQFMSLGAGNPPIHIPTPVMQHPILGGGFGNHGGLPHNLSTPLPPVPSREYSLYPWLLSRHGRVFQGGFPGPEYPGFLLPFRKPKRVRTAFSPSQLLKLEQAFEKNQYVVGQERKQLAVNLHLSETQVKVWFQNRRTKHKRQQQEGDEDGGCKGDADKDEGLILEHDEEDEELDVLDHHEDMPRHI